MTKKVKEIIKNMSKDGLVGKIHKILVDMKKEGKITKDSEIPECFGIVADRAGVDQPSDMGLDRLRAFANVVERELEKIFGLKVFAGYFVTESFKPITKKKFSALLESAVNSLYEGYEDYEFEENEKDETNDYYKSYYRPFNEPKRIIKNEPRAITVLSDDNSLKITAYQRGRRFSDRRGGNESYNGSYWVMKIIKDGIVLSQKELHNKQQVLEEIYSMQEFSKAKQELS